jgi:hypothetical protein
MLESKLAVWGKLQAAALCNLQPTGEIQRCDLEIEMSRADEIALSSVVRILEDLGAPKGSSLLVEESKTSIAFGKAEGLGVYLNGTDLPTETYRDSDSNFVYSELRRLTQGRGRVLSYWQGPTETAFYLYGQSFQEMNALIAELLATYPLSK